MLRIAEHPLLDARCFVTVLPSPLSALPSPDWLQALLKLDAVAPLRADDTIRATVRDLLRHGGYKPTGRGKPASEYLLRAVGEGALGSINAAVDSCNVVSLHSGLPVSVVDLDLASAPFQIAVAEAGTSYVFNASGQVIDVGGLLCLFDAGGPCANAVKDAQRTKTNPRTQKTLSVIWGAKSLSPMVTAALDWYRQLLAQVGATTELL
jgi:DNA/RNA-binding domain of Phe-tRNA-synthetase-like protein